MNRMIRTISLEEFLARLDCCGVNKSVMPTYLSGYKTYTTPCFFLCPQCHNSYLTKPSMIYWMYSHWDGKSHCCSECNKKRIAERGSGSAHSEKDALHDILAAQIPVKLLKYGGSYRKPSVFECTIHLQQFETSMANIINNYKHGDGTGCKECRYERYRTSRTKNRDMIFKELSAYYDAEFFIPTFLNCHNKNVKQERCLYVGAKFTSCGHKTISKVSTFLNARKRISKWYTGCPICSSGHIFQRIVTDMVMELFQDTYIEVPIAAIATGTQNHSYRVDLYIPSKNTVVECNGLQHTSDEIVIDRDKNKCGILAEYGIKTIYIPYPNQHPLDCIPEIQSSVANALKL